VLGGKRKKRGEGVLTETAHLERKKRGEGVLTGTAHLARVWLEECLVGKKGILQCL